MKNDNLKPQTPKHIVQFKLTLFSLQGFHSKNILMSGVKVQQHFLINYSKIKISFCARLRIVAANVNERQKFIILQCF